MENNSVRTILFLAANPSNLAQLRLGEEAREIEEALIRSKKRDQFKLEQQWAVRPKDIRRAMLDYSPKIVHFSGHGIGRIEIVRDSAEASRRMVAEIENQPSDEALFLENEMGETQPVSKGSLARLFKLFSTQVECVILNACYSRVQAEVIATHIPYVIGMNRAIGDRAALIFAVGFYDALGAGRDIEFAYQLACNSIEMEGISEHLTPVLIQKVNSFNLPPNLIDSFLVVDNLISTWITKLGAEQALICQRELRNKPNIINIIDTKIEDLWNEFISSQPWHEEVKLSISLIKENIDIINSQFDTSLKDRSYKTFLQKLYSIDIQSSYIEIKDKLERIINDKFYRDILKIILELEAWGEENKLNNEDLKNIKKFHQFLVDFKSFVTISKFKKCFLLLGSLGTGKTHFIYNLINNSITSHSKNSDGYKFLVLNIKISNSNLEETILIELKEKSGIDSWKSLSEFNSYLQNNNIEIKIIIVIDNIHKFIINDWGTQIDYKHQLIDFITKNTNLHNVYWLISLLDTNYDQVIDRKSGEFWQQYSFLTNNINQIKKLHGEIDISKNYTIPCMDGLIYLDYLNYFEGLGFSLLKKNIEKVSNDYKDFFDNNILCNITKQVYIDYLSNPLIAWIIIESGENHNLEDIVSLNFAEFIELFQKIILDEMSSIGASQPNYYAAYIEPILRNSASFLIHQKYFSCCFQYLVSNLLDKICTKPMEIYLNRIERILSLLQDVNLMFKVTPATECDCNERISLLLEPFWFWQYAQMCLTSYKDNEVNTDIIKQIEITLSEFSNDLLKEEILIFILLLLDLEKIKESISVSLSFEQIYYEIIENSNFPTSAAWLSGVRSIPEVQEILINWAENNNGSINEKRILFSFVYFISRNQILSISDRFRLLKSYFITKINKFGLSSYFLFAAKLMLVPNKFEFTEK